MLKKPRLDDFRRKLPYASESALVAIFDAIKHHGLPAATSRASFHRAKQKLMLTNTPFGNLTTQLQLQGSQGGFELPNVNPLSMLFMAFKQGGGYSEMLAEKLRRKPPSFNEPWQLIFYTDEITPGSALSADNKRKAWAIYMSFLQLGPIALQKEEAWLCVGIHRSSEVSRAHAGISQIMASVVKCFFQSLDIDASLGQFWLESPSGEKVRLFLKVGMFLQDGAAHKLVFHCKGDAGTRCCMLCINLIAQTSKIARDEYLSSESGFVCSHCTEEGLVFATDSDVKATLQRLAEKRNSMTKGNFELYQRAAGFNYQPCGLLADRALSDHIQPVTQYCHDWMHCIFVGGAFNTVFWLLLCELSLSVRNLYANLDEYFNMWKFPRHLPKSWHSSIFTKKRFESNKRAEAFKCSASEGLTIYPIIALFLQSIIIPAKQCLSACKAFLALADLVDVLQAIPIVTVTPNSLQACVAKFLTLCVQAGWAEHMHPKFHWMIHFSQHLEKFKMLPSCFVHERKHKTAKKYMNSLHNTKSFESSVLTEVCLQELSDSFHTQTFSKPGLLENPTEAQGKVLEYLQDLLADKNSSILMSETVCLDPVGKCGVDDVVLLETAANELLNAGIVCCNLQVNEKVFSICRLLRLESFSKEKMLAIWSKTTDMFIVDIVHIKCAVVFSTTADDKLRCIIPLQCNPNL